MNDEELNQKLKPLKSAIEYVGAKVVKGSKDQGTNYPLNTGDIMLLVMLIERELPVAPSDWTEPLNVKRLRAIREKLGSLAVDSPKMSKEEAKQFRE